MKNIIKFFGLLSLIGFSFFYTDKVMDVVMEQDSIMIEINQVKDNYMISAMDAIVTENTLIPGIDGRVVNVEESYNNMKSIGIFHANYFVFDDIRPSISMDDYKEKYIIQGNSNKHMVSLIFILNDNTNLDKIYEISKKKNVKINFFVDYQYLNSNTTKIKQITNANFYSYGIKGEYAPDTLLFSNNLIERIKKQKANYCLTNEKNDEVLTLCSNQEMFTIVPNIIIKDNIYNEIRNQITSGSIILFPTNNANIDALELTIDYIQAKGLKIGYLNELLSEELEEN